MIQSVLQVHGEFLHLMDVRKTSCKYYGHHQMSGAVWVVFADDMQKLVQCTLIREEAVAEFTLVNQLLRPLPGLNLGCLGKTRESVQPLHAPRSLLLFSAACRAPDVLPPPLLKLVMLESSYSSSESSSTSLSTSNCLNCERYEARLETPCHV